MRPDCGQLGGVDRAELDQAGVEDVHRVPLAEQEAVAPARRRVLELQDVEEQRRHQVGARHRAAEVAVLRGGDRDDVPAQRGGAAAERG